MTQPSRNAHKIHTAVLSVRRNFSILHVINITYIKLYHHTQMRKVSMRKFYLPNLLKQYKQ